jgi:predicted nucleic acid-binding protein
VGWSIAVRRSHRCPDPTEPPKPPARRADRPAQAVLRCSAQAAGAPSRPTRLSRLGGAAAAGRRRRFLFRGLRFGANDGAVAAELRGRLRLHPARQTTALVVAGAACAAVGRRGRFQFSDFGSRRTLELERSRRSIMRPPRRWQRWCGRRGGERSEVRGHRQQIGKSAAPAGIRCSARSQEPMR